MLSFDDPDYLPPKDIHGADARAYEEKIVELLREAAADANALNYPIQPGRVRSIVLCGTRPDTEIVFHFEGPMTFKELERNAARSRTHAVVFQLWRSGYPASTGKYANTLDSAASVASGIWSDWCSDNLQPLDPEEM